MPSGGQRLSAEITQLQELAIHAAAGKLDATKVCAEIAHRLDAVHALMMDAIVEAHIAGQTKADRER